MVACGFLVLGSAFVCCAPVGAAPGSNNPTRTKEAAIPGLRMDVFSGFVRMILSRLLLKQQVSLEDAKHGEEDACEPSLSDK
jgi:hypothetical protein